jgi:hypothetical protein
MSDISNKSLVFLVILSIGISAVTTLALMNKLNTIPQIATGGATTQHGNITLEIESTLSIVLRESVVNFGSGYVNGSCRFNEGEATNNATLTAGETFENLNGCWTNQTALPTSLRLENDGNMLANVLVKGPSDVHFFNDYSGTNPFGLLWKARDSTGEVGACSGTLQEEFTGFDDTEKSVCTALSFDPSTQDEISIDVRVIIPADLEPGIYQNSTIEFTATSAT